MFVMVMAGLLGLIGTGQFKNICNTAKRVNLIYFVCSKLYVPAGCINLLIYRAYKYN